MSFPDQDIYQCCGYIDIHRINPDAWPALVADLSSGGQSITALAFGNLFLVFIICLSSFGLFAKKLDCYHFFNE